MPRRAKSGWSYGSQYAIPREARELTEYDIDKMVAEDTVKYQHPIIQQLADQRVKLLSSQPQKGEWPHER